MSKSPENRLLVDMDGVMADFMGKVFEIVRNELDVSYCHADITDYWFSNIPHKDRFKAIIEMEGVYRHLNPITGVKEAINRLREQYEVVPCSAPPITSKTAETEKREWLAEHFDNELAESAIITRDKHLVTGRVLIEDNPHIDRNAAWKPIIFDQIYNRDVNDLPVMYGWGDIKVVEEYMNG